MKLSSTFIKIWTFSTWFGQIFKLNTFHHLQLEWYQRKKKQEVETWSTNAKSKLFEKRKYRPTMNTDLRKTNKLKNEAQMRNPNYLKRENIDQQWILTSAAFNWACDIFHFLSVIILKYKREKTQPNIPRRIG